MCKKALMIFMSYLFCSLLSVVYAADKTKLLSSNASVARELSITYFGARGDGAVDDTVAVQRALTKCSEEGLICTVPGNMAFLITKPIFIWGEASLIGNSDSSVMLFKVVSAPYLVNLGISKKNQIKSPFSGTIAGVTFKIIGGKKGRIIYFWRVKGAKITGNKFQVGNHRYSATSSGNENSWLRDINAYIRKDIVISDNKIVAAADNLGSEGIGLGDFNGAVISNNSIVGVGDDPIGVHYCENVKISNNYMESVDGRLYISNSRNVDIVNNVVKRMPSLLDKTFHKGIALIYIGFELYGRKNSLSAPTNIKVYHNALYYPPGAIDTGAAIYIYAPRNVEVTNNSINNDSKYVKASAIHLLPARFKAKWMDPDSRDGVNMARVYDVSITGNVAAGKYPQNIIMTGKCVDYVGNVQVRDNVAKKYQLFCGKVVSAGNKEHSERRDN